MWNVQLKIGNGACARWTARGFATVAVFLALAAAAPAQEDSDEPVVVPRLEIGDPAPALQIKEYVKGEPVDLRKGREKNVFVVEFWATWCPPCRDSVSHLSSVQEAYKDRDVIVVGVTMETKDEVEPFVEKMGEKMEYAVAIDEDGKTTMRYMGGFGRDGIPHAFIIDKDGCFAWEGHPMMLEEGLALVLGPEPNETE